jgi:hypothetical protein
MFALCLFLGKSSATCRVHGMKEGENLIYSHRFTFMNDYFEQRNDEILQEESEKVGRLAEKDMLHAESHRNLSTSVINIPRSQK